MAVQNTEVYHRACNVAKSLEASILKEDTEPRDKALCARELVNVERFKREMRGIPAIAPYRLKDMPLRRAKAKLLTEQPTEVSQ